MNFQETRQALKAVADTPSPIFRDIQPSFWCLSVCILAFSFNLSGGPAQSVIEFARPGTYYTYSISETNRLVEARVVRTGDLGATSAVTLETIRDSAIENEDFGPSNVSLEFLPGETQKIVSISILDDRSHEGLEWFTLRLTNAINAIINSGAHQIAVQISDDEQPVVYDLRSNVTADADGALSTLVTQPDGKILFGGTFSRVRGVQRHGLARLNQDLSLDSSFSLDERIAFYNLGGAPHGILLQTDGKIVIAGIFRETAGLFRRYSIARLRSDGSLDETFLREPISPLSLSKPTSTLEPSSMAITADGKIWVSGAYGGDGRHQYFVARLNPDGSRDSSFVDVSVGSVATLLALPDGRVLAGGGGDGKSPPLVRLLAGGERDQGFDATSAFVDGGFFGDVSSLAQTPDGDILLATPISDNSGQHEFVRRLAPDGSWESSFVAPKFPVRTSAHQMLVQRDGKPVFLFPGLRSQLLRLDIDGRLDRSLQLQASSSDIDVRAALTPDGRIAVGLSIQEGRDVRCAIGYVAIDSIPMSSVGFGAHAINVVEGSPVAQVRLERRGDRIEPATVQYSIREGSAGSGTDYASSKGTITLSAEDAGATIQIPILDDGLVEREEWFFVELSNPSPGIILGPNSVIQVRITDNETAASVDRRFQPKINGPVHQAIPNADGRIFLTGSFFGINGSRRSGVAMLEASGDLNESFINVPTGSVWPYPAILQDNGKIVGVFGYSLYRLNTDGSRDTNFNSAFPVESTAMAIQKDSSFLVATDRGLDRYARDGSYDRALLTTDSFSATGIDRRSILTVVEQPDGRLLIGGNFSTIRGVQRDFLARLAPDGVLDSGFVPGFGPSAPSNSVPQIEGGPVTSIVLQSDGRILIGGAFRRVGDIPRDGVARLKQDGSVDLSFKPIENVWDNATPPRDVQDVKLALIPDGRIVAGRRFSWDQYQIVRLAEEGSLDSTFYLPPIGLSYPSSTYPTPAFVMTAAGELLLYGNILYVQGKPYRGLIKLNGEQSRETEFNLRVPVLYAGEGDGSVLVTVERVGDVSTSASVDIVLDGAFGQPSSPFTPQRETLRFEPLETTKSFNVPIRDNSVTAPSESASLLLSNPSAGTRIGLGRGTLTVVDDDRSGSLDLSFRPFASGDVAATDLSARAFQADGRIWIQGRIWTITGEQFVFARVSPSGGQVEDLRNLQGFANGIRSVGPDGSMLVQSWTGLIKMRPDGSFDPSFQPLTFAVTAEFQPDGRILTTSANGQRVTRFTADGKPDGFDFYLEGGERYWPVTTATDSRGRIFIGGTFKGIRPAVSSTSALASLARINADGTIDFSFRCGLGAADRAGKNGYVTKIMPQPNGRVLVGGLVHLADGIWQWGMARLNEDGSLDPSFPSQPRTLLGLFPDGRLLTVSIDGMSMDRLNQDGSIDSTFLSPVFANDPNDGSPLVTSVHVQPDGKIAVVGRFISVNGVPSPGLARLNADVQLRLDTPQRLPDSQWRFHWSAPPGERHELQASEDLSEWRTVVTTNSTSASLEAVAADSQATAVRFFRLKLLR